MQAHLVALALIVLASSACGGSEQTAAPRLSPAPRVAPTEEPEQNFDEAPAAEAPPKGGSDEAASDVCEGLATIPDSDSPADSLRSLAAEAAEDGVPFARFIKLLRRAYVKADVEKARGYIDRLSAICEDVTGRRNF